MDLPFGGGCACGTIRYECAAPPRYMGNCHCTDCQQATGSAFLPAVMVKENEFSLRSGEPIWFERPSDRGHPMRHTFYPACGSPLFLVKERTRRFGCSMRAAWTPRAGTGRAGRSMWRARSLGVSCTLTSPMTRVCRGDSRPICR